MVYLCLSSLGKNECVVSSERSGCFYTQETVVMLKDRVNFFFVCMKFQICLALTV